MTNTVNGKHAEALAVEPIEPESNQALAPKALEVYVMEKTVNDGLKEVVTDVVSFVPEVGAAFSKIIAFFWPASESDPKKIWESIKKYAEAYMKELIDDAISQHNIGELENLLDGIRNVLKDYQAASVGTRKKREMFSGVLTALDLAEPFFLNKSHPEKTLPYFISMGTIKLAALREQVLFYEKIYGETDPNPASTLKQLQDKITEYKETARALYDVAVKWRMDKITKFTTSEADGWFAHYDQWHARDTMDGWSIDGHYRESAVVDYEFNNRWSQISNQFRAEMDAFIETSYLWPYMDPTVTRKPTRTPVLVKSGPFGGRNGDPFSDNPDGKPITRVAMYTDDRFIKAIEVFYGGQSGGLHRGGDAQLQDLVLQAGEKIVAAHGSSGDALETLFFTTNTGREVGGGGGNRPWSAAPPKGTDAALVAIEGKVGGSIEGITFHWQYWRNQ
jgi:hypothetical protein